MSTLAAFLNPKQPIRQEKEVIISTRFQDESGNPVPFKIRAMSQEEIESVEDRAAALATRTGKNVDIIRTHILAVEGTVQPDFSASDLCTAYGVLDPLMVPGKMLLPGEFTALIKEITSLFKVDIDAIDNDVKN